MSAITILNKNGVNIADYAMNAIRPALIEAHNTGNRRAIDVKLCKKVGVTEERLEDWCLWVENLQDAVIEYVEAKHNASTSDKDLKALYGKIFPVWRTVLKMGKPTDGEKMWTREQDVQSLVGYCETFARVKEVTTQAVETKTLFRKKVESLIGCRIAEGIMLSRAENETLSEYYKAVRTKVNGEKALNGTTDGKGNVTPGLYHVLNVLKGKVKDRQDLLAALNLPAEDPNREKIQITIHEAEVEVTTTEETIKQTEQRVKDAEVTIEKLQADAEAIEAKASKPIHVEQPTTEEPEQESEETAEEQAE